MPNTFTLIQAVTVPSGGAANITFSSIPQTYTDLCILASTRSVSSGPAQTSIIRFNGDTTSSNYPFIRLIGSGTAVSTATQANVSSGFFTNNAGSTTSTFANSVIYIPNYAGSASKSLSIDTVTENNGTEAYAGLMAMRWTGTSAITSIVFTNESTGNFSEYSTAYLYGIVSS